MSRVLELMDEMERIFVDGYETNRDFKAVIDDWKSLRTEVDRLEARIAELKVEFAGPVSEIEARALERFADEQREAADQANRTMQLGVAYQAEYAESAARNKAARIRAGGATLSPPDPYHEPGENQL